MSGAVLNTSHASVQFHPHRSLVRDFYIHFKVGETEAERDECAPSLYTLLMLTPDLFFETSMFLTIRNAVTPGQEVPGR